MQTYNDVCTYVIDMYYIILLYIGKGHYSKAVGNMPRNSIFIPVNDDFIVPNNK